jgi:hypothetical protein
MDHQLRTDAPSSNATGLVHMVAPVVVVPPARELTGRRQPSPAGATRPGRSVIPITRPPAARDVPATRTTPRTPQQTNASRTGGADD